MKQKYKFLTKCHEQGRVLTISHVTNFTMCFKTIQETYIMFCSCSKDSSGNHKLIECKIKWKCDKSLRAISRKNKQKTEVFVKIFEEEKHLYSINNLNMILWRFRAIIAIKIRYI